MARTILVDDLIEETRALLDEENQEDISDTRDILPALNRAQDVAANILSKHYSAPLRRYKMIDIVSGQQEYDIPDEAFEERVELIEVQVGQYFYPLKQLDPQDATYYEASNTSTIPYAYVLTGNRVRLLPNSNPTYKLRMWFDKDPDKLVKQQGRIELVDTTTNSIVVDSVGGDISTESDNLSSYVNVIDGVTGRRKATLQIQKVVGNEITFKTSPSRTVVKGVSIDNSLETLLRNSEDQIEQGEDLVISPDDYICALGGSCIPIFRKPLYNYIIKYAVAELRGVVDGSDSYTEAEVQKMEKIVENSWSGRPNTARVKRAPGMWGNTYRKRGLGSKLV